MIRTSAFLFVLGALVGCNPLMYVPQPIPAAPRTTGVEVQGDLGMAFLSGQIRATGSPADGLGLYASGHFAGGGSGSDGDWNHSGRGGEVGVLGLGRFGEIGFVEGGIGVGTTSVRAYDYYFDRGPDDIRADVVRSSAHIGVGVERDLEPGYGRTEYMSVGFLVRGTYVNVQNVRATDGGFTSYEDEAQRFIEPAFRFRYDADVFAIETQAGISLPLETDAYRQYDAYPLFGGVGLSFRLDRLFSSRPPSRPAIPNAP